MHPRQILAALADLAPAPGERVLDVSRGGQPLVWLPEPDRATRSRGTDRLAALDALNREERILRRGAAFVVGSLESEGVRRAVRLPLLTQPVRLERGLRGYRVVPAGDLELTALVEDPVLAAQLEAVPGLGEAAWLRAVDTAGWLRAAAGAAGMVVADVVAHPPKHLPETKLVGVTASALFVVRDVRSPGLRDTLLTWAQRPGLESTALATVYGLRDGSDADRAQLSTSDEAIASPLPLNKEQREVVRRARAEPLVVVSGPPGNGKSHALVAAALEVVDRGGSVLIAAQSSAAVGALDTLLRRYPGPMPVLFGDAERREALAAELGQGMTAGVGDRQLRADDETVAAAAARVSAVHAGIAAALETEQRAATMAYWEPLISGLDADVPQPFRTDFDLARARTLAISAGVESTRWWRRRVTDVVRWRLRRLAGAGAAVPLARVLAALDAAAANRAAGHLAATGGTELGPAWRELTDADAALATAIGEAMRHRAGSARRWTRPARRSAVALAGALQAGRNRRREMLASLDGPALVRALPLWIGTVTDVEDLLPPVPGLFDLVIVDEGVHVDQIRAAPVFARARRALVAGDPQQLRFVSFVADMDVSVALERHGLGALADRMDVRRASAFDVAAGAAPVTGLVEHYRSAPHLIEFSARRFYRDRIELVTRHPRNEGADLIDVRTVAGMVVDGVNQVEIAAALDEIRAVAAAGHTDIAVITPFRAQADALEAALLAAFPVDQIEGLRLRSGTVHACQGSEADTVIVSLGLVDHDSPARHRFVADPNLFNVLVTRARQKMIVVTSLTSANGIIGDYLSYAAAVVPWHDPPPARAQPWVDELGTQLRHAGLPVRVAYPVGMWHVDLCCGAGVEARGLVCGVHPEGPESHVERQRTLLRAGWELVDAFPSRWAGNCAKAAVELSTGDRFGVL